MYPADFLSDENAIALSIHAFGAWTKTLLIMWRAESGSLTKTLPQWGRAWGLNGAARAEKVMAEIGTVGGVTENPDGTWTITSRRIALELAKMGEKREANRQRKAKWLSSQEEDQEQNTRTHSERIPDASKTRLDMISEYDSSLKRDEEAEPQEKPGGDEFPFSTWWDAFAHKIDRSKCAAKWGRMKVSDRKLAMEHTLRYVAVTHTDGTFPSRKNPLTYLNARSWLDEDLPAAQPIVAMNGHAHSAKRSCTNCGGALGSDHASHQGRPYCGTCYDRAPWLRAHSLQAA